MNTTHDAPPNAPQPFLLGCNYWASHAGTRMWADWRPDVVEADLCQLAAAGLRTLRVFPLWPDFQPITLLRTGHGRPQEIRMGEEPLPETDAGRAGMSEVCLGRFERFANLAAANNLRLIVGLITGWMSGRLFVPPALEGLNVLTDPRAILWQTRFVRHFVRRFRGQPAIAAWDLGNECNCMAPVPGREAAWVWTSALTSAIRAEDPGRPIFSGMHGLSAQSDEPWTIRDQAELTDVLTTHPYPIFTPHCDRDPVTTIRPLLHATAESCLYSDVGGRPCVAEELGTLGPMIASDDQAALYLRAVLLSLWAHGAGGCLWWCAYDQEHLAHAPYDWHAYERELGLIRSDRTPKPVLETMRQFAEFLRRAPAPLPPRRTDACCILTADQDAWGAAFSSFILAKQAGFDLAFRHAAQPIPESSLYLLPSLSGAAGFTRRFWLDLQARVRGGATLYVSVRDAMLSGFADVFGVEVRTRERRSAPVEFAASALSGAPRFAISSPIRLNLVPRGAEVLAAEADGNPVWLRSPLGRGTVHLLTVPIETALAETAGAFHAPGAMPWALIYRHVAEAVRRERAATAGHPAIGLTEHPAGPAERIVVAINYGAEPVDMAVQAQDGWAVRSIHNSSGRGFATPQVQPFDAIVIRMARREGPGAS